MLGLFGIYRLILATMVAFSHLGPFAHSACGYYAVFAFFTLSGYLMTLVLHEQYRHLPNGTRRYFANRALRIYPPYWLAAGVSCLLIALWPETASYVHVRMVMPDSFWTWLPNIIIFGMALPHGALVQSALIPPSWSLSTELLFYLLLPFVIRKPFGFWWWVVFSILFYISFIIDKQNLATRYYSVIAGSMPFAVGSAMYFLREKLTRLPHAVAAIIIPAALICHMFALELFPVAMEEGFYAAYLLNVLVIYYLCRIDQRHIPPALRRADKIMGDLAYPVFLVHLPVGIMVMRWWPQALEAKSFYFFLIAMPFTYLASYLLAQLVELPVNRVRKRIKETAAA